MHAIERILVATDLSTAARDAVREAALLARTFGSRIHLAHAIPNVPGASETYEVVRERIQERLDEVRDELAAEGVAVAGEVWIDTGPPGDLVVAAASDVDADVIVIGAGEKTKLDRVLLGSTAERVVRIAPEPVWIVPPEKPNVDLKRIVCAVDASDPGREALVTAIFLARSFTARLDLVTVISETDEGTEAEEKLRACIREFDLHMVEHAFHVRHGKPAVEIVAAVADLGPDVLVLGSAARTGVSRWMRGNMAEKIVRLVPCSMLVVKQAGIQTRTTGVFKKP